MTDKQQQPPIPKEACAKAEARGHRVWCERYGTFISAVGVACRRCEHNAAGIELKELPAPMEASIRRAYGSMAARVREHVADKRIASRDFLSGRMAKFKTVDAEVKTLFREITVEAVTHGLPAAEGEEMIRDFGLDAQATR